MLLAQPELAQSITVEATLRRFDLPGVPLLLELIELLQRNPHISTGALLERYRDTETGAILARLAQWRPVISEELFQAEFTDIFQQLNQRAAKHLFDKAARGELSHEERELLRQFGQREEVKV